MANKRELLKEFGPKIIEVYGEEELKWIKENFGSDELEKYIKEDHDSFRGYRRGKTKLTRRKTMPHGKGTYGSKVGRPKKMTKAQAGKTKMSGDSRLSDQDLAYIKKMLANLPKAKDPRLSDKDLAGSSRMSDQDLALSIYSQMKKGGATRNKKKPTVRKTGGVTTAKKGKSKFSGGTSKKKRGLLKKLGKDFMSTAKKGKAKVGK